ncbi:MAG: FeoA family protein [Treponema sp.]|nr:ferrous iron transport protein A [Spirochaetia bacterium]MDD7460374.1 FeoA family protein [Spirochaetales bacterium]MDY5811217.1 FeoA family protein [Treponema sp.]MEE1182102.1 FeoA family protein [Treponema sp.]
MPLSLAKSGESALIKKVGGKEETKRFLANLGFIPGASVTVVSEISGNIIVLIKDSRIAVSKEMAAKIII